MPQVRQPKLAEIVAARLREDILTGRLKEGDELASQERLFSEYQVSPPALREALRILETDGLITVRRGSVGGAVVHAPSPRRAAQLIAMILQNRTTSSGEVSIALGHMEPICARLCALREDRADTVVPALRAILARQRGAVGDSAEFRRHARDFHAAIIAECGNEPMIVVIGALEAIWLAHGSPAWAAVADGIEGVATLAATDTPQSAEVPATRWAALQAHEKITDEIEAGNADRAYKVSAGHLRPTHPIQLDSAGDQRILASLLGEVRLPGGVE